ncbi:MAG: hypothetical protein ACTH0S_06650 [Senegalia sp. (in: firmicutes)]
MVIAEYIIDEDKVSLEDGIKIKKEIFFRQFPEIKKDKGVKELLTIEIVKHNKNKKIIQFKIDE